MNKEIKENQFFLKRKVALLSVLIFVLGFMSAVAVRFILVDRHETHYHANFALYINGQKEDFNNFNYYEEISSCSSADHGSPKSRVHMHNKENSVIHVHDDGVTWSHFFNNLGFTLSDKALITKDKIYIPEETTDSSAKLRFILNGKLVNFVSNETIKSKDALLIDYSKDTDEELQKRYEAIIKNAQEYNSKQDPNTCAGGGTEKFSDRLKRTLGVQDSH